MVHMQISVTSRTANLYWNNTPILQNLAQFAPLPCIVSTEDFNQVYRQLWVKNTSSEKIKKMLTWKYIFIIQKMCVAKESWPDLAALQIHFPEMPDHLYLRAILTPLKWPHGKNISHITSHLELTKAVHRLANPAKWAHQKEGWAIINSTAILHIRIIEMLPLLAEVITVLMQSKVNEMYDFS